MKVATREHRERGNRVTSNQRVKVHGKVTLSNHPPTFKRPHAHILTPIRPHLNALQPTFSTHPPTHILTPSRPRLTPKRATQPPTQRAAVLSRWLSEQGRSSRLTKLVATYTALCRYLHSADTAQWRGLGVVGGSSAKWCASPLCRATLLQPHLEGPLIKYILLSRLCV